jgi:hypothetical protein
MAVSRETLPVTISIDHTFISYARHDSAFVTEVAAGLRSRGVPIWIDQWNIKAGANWSASIDAALNACGKMLIVLSPEAVASDEVLGEIRAAQNGRKRITPLLHRPCEIPRGLLLTHYLDWSRSTDVTDASIDELAEVLRSMPTSPLPPPPDRDASGRRALLDDVTTEARARLQSLGTDKPIAILMDRQPHQVARPWDGELVVPERRRSSPLAVDILEVFDDHAVDGNLLILGAPGSGKTTMLVQLLQHLAERANPQAGNEPIPVLLSLASWKRKKPFDHWLVAELNVKYGVRRDVGRQWLDDGLLIPLLDGLDEVAPNDQQACVEAINAFQAAFRPRHLVVCCRLAEYEQLTTTLRLHDAVCLQPLDAAQIRAFLDRADASTLWNPIESDATLLEMACSPLLLSFISSMASEPDGALTREKPSGAERRRQLFERYLSSRFSARAGRLSYSPQRTMRALQQLATILDRKCISEFLIERMQPDWLQSRAERWSYGAGVLLVSFAAVFLTQQLLLALFDLIPRGDVGLALQQSRLWQSATHDTPIGRSLAFVLPVVVGTVVALRKTIIPIETLTWSWARAATNARLWAQTGVIAGVDYGIAIGAAIGVIAYAVAFRAGGPEASVWQSVGQVMGSFGGVLAAILLGWMRPAAWFVAARRSFSKQHMTEPVIAAFVYAVVTTSRLGWVIGALSGIAVFAVVGLSAVSNNRDRVVLLRWPLAAASIGALVGGLTASVLPLSATRLLWITMWVNGALAAGMIAGLTRTVFAVLRDRWRTTLTVAPAATNPAWKRFGVTAVVAAVALGISALLTARLAGIQPIRNVLLLLWFTQAGFVLALLYVAFGAVCVAIAGGSLAGILGGLAGALSGATGADVERRLMPNQGIRQSAVNVVIFSALGAVVGQLYGLLNLSAAASTARMLPTSGDWLRFGVGAGVNLGVLAGFLPGAACIQHFVLRFVLWGAGAFPLRFVRFLDFATERRVLQRVGGRYRFIHVLLRDHLADRSGRAEFAETHDA